MQQSVSSEETLSVTQQSSIAIKNVKDPDLLSEVARLKEHF